MVNSLLINQVVSHLQSLGDESIAEHSQRFFKTGEGEYGYGDKFWGIRVPVIRKTIPKFKQLTADDALELLKHPVHEVRLFALLHWVYQYNRADEEKKAQIYHYYLEHTHFINNWDLVDTSCHHIVGAYLKDKSREPLYQLAQSTCLWQKRISMMSTYHFIKQDDFDDALALAKILLNDSHDLIHKVVGWMLREVGNRDRQVEEAFLLAHYQNMPRTMLRYAIEKFPKERRQEYLKGEL